MNKKRIFSILVICILAFGILSGCAGNSGADTTEKPEVKEPEEKKITAPADKEVAMMYANTPYCDPAVGSDEASVSLFPNVYDTLVFPTTLGEVIPWVAKDWTVSDDGLVYTFDLRDDVTFHNGGKLTASDVKFSMDRLNTIGEGFAYLYKDKVDKVEAINDTQVKITLKEVYGPFISTLVRLYILNEDEVMANVKKDGTYGDKGDYGKSYLVDHDAGSGPYTITEYIANKHVVGKKYENYWGGFEEGNPEGFRLMASPETITVKTMMSRGEVEITDFYQPMEAYAEMDAMDGIDLTSYNSGSMMYITMNNKKEPTDDIHFRKAIAHLIDSATVCESIFKGSVPAKGMITSIVAGADKENKLLKYDLELAKKELAQSKYADKLDSIVYTIYWVAETPEREKLALYIQSQASKIGLKVKVEKVPWLKLVEDAANSKTTPNSATVLTSAGYAEAGSQLVASYLSKEEGSGTWESLDWYSNSEFDKIVNDAMTTIDFDERIEKYIKAQKMMLENYITAPVFEIAEVHAYQSGYLDWETANLAKAGKPVNPVLGYAYFLKEMKFK